MRKVLLILFWFIGFFSNAQALDLMIGLNIANKSIQIDDKVTGQNEIATMDNGIQYNPTIGLRTEARYFGNENTNWGYFYQFDMTKFDINSQTLDGNEEQNIGTSMKGYSSFAVPTTFYHFNKSSIAWSQKVGIGLGVGYIKMSGDFKITNKSHQLYGQIQQVDFNEFCLVGGILYEFSNNNHSIVIQNFAPIVSDDRYYYTQHNVDIMYRYKFSF